jgi:putative ABC transport system permease protein
VSLSDLNDSSILRLDLPPVRERWQAHGSFDLNERIKIFLEQICMTSLDLNPDESILERARVAEAISFSLKRHVNQKQRRSRTDHILTFGVPVRYDRFKSPEQMIAFYQELIEKMEALPDVRRVSISTPPPVPVPLIDTWILKFSIPGRPSADPSRPLYEARARAISDGFVETFGARVAQGRAFTAQDHFKSERVVMINETFAREYLTGLDPLTQVLLISGSPLKSRIIGVFRDIHNAEEFGHRNAPEIYVPFPQFPFPSPTLAVWTSNEPAQLRKSISTVVRSMDRGLPVANVRTLEEMISDQLAFGRFEAIIYSSFAGLALLLAVVGIY